MAGLCSKDAVVLLVDVCRRMEMMVDDPLHPSEKFSALVRAQLMASLMVQQRICYRAQDFIGLVVFGSDYSENSLMNAE
ncbi:hypothetical protein SARC_16895, partial [Sphaeroforma arctica JP610]